MPFYDFKNEKSGAIITLFFHMNDEKKYVDDKGYLWTRVFYNPQASFDTKIDIRSSKDFVNKTRNKAGNLGQILDLSKELSEKREQRDGVDHIKQGYFDNYSKKRRGTLSPLERKEKMLKSLKENKHIDVRD